MEPHQYQYGQKQTFSGETFSSPFPYQEKIQARKRTVVIILYVVFQLIILFFSVSACLASLITVVVSVIINMVLLNVLFFIMLWVLRTTIQRGRRLLYSCLIFVTNLVLLFACLYGLEGGHINSVSPIVAWMVGLLVNALIYCLMKFVPQGFVSE